MMSFVFERELLVKVCGVDLKASEARLAVASANADGLILVPCSTKKFNLADDKDAQAIRAFLKTIKTFAHENAVDVFAIKARAHGGKMGGGAISFKIETLFQLADCETVFVNAVALARFAKGNLGGLPNGLLKYQEDAYLCAAFHLNKLGKI